MLLCLYLLGSFFMAANSHNTYTEPRKNCSMRYIQMRVKFANCLPVRLLTNACSGACASYTTTSALDPRKLETKCECCHYVSRKKKRFGIKCPHKTQKDLYKIRVLTISVPKRCLCRPCSDTPNNILSAEQEILLRNPMLDLLRIYPLL
jgi:hypothetical protein